MDDKRRKYLLENKKHIAKKQREYYDNNKEKILSYNKKYYKDKKDERKFKTIMYSIKNRCLNKNCHAFSRYGGRGIKVEITIEELEKLWNRDSANKMKCPTIDRIDNNGNYSYDNCQFIEKTLNSKKDSSKKIIQYDLKGNKIKEFCSINEASRKLNIPNSSIYKVLAGQRKQTHGYLFVTAKLSDISEETLRKLREV